MLASSLPGIQKILKCLSDQCMNRITRKDEFSPCCFKQGDMSLQNRILATCFLYEQSDVSVHLQKDRAHDNSENPVTQDLHPVEAHDSHH